MNLNLSAGFFISLFLHVACTCAEYAGDCDTLLKVLRTQVHGVFQLTFNSFKCNHLKLRFREIGRKYIAKTLRIVGTDLEIPNIRKRLFFSIFLIIHIYNNNKIVSKWP